MNIVITAATENEWRQIEQKINSLNSINGIDNISFHTSGVGLMVSTFSLFQCIIEHKPDLIIQVGIAGCFNQSINVGEVVVVKDEYLGDTGVEEDGIFKDVFDLKLLNKDAFPFKYKGLSNPWLTKLNFLQLPEVVGVTVNEVSTRKQRIEQIKTKYAAVTESMEGAALHYIGLQKSTPFLQVRAISNLVGERDKSKWKIDGALHNLTNTVLKIIEYACVTLTKV